MFHLKYEFKQWYFNFSGTVPQKYHNHDFSDCEGR